MFIGKVSRHLVYVFFFIHLMKGLHQVGTTYLTRRDATGMTLVDHVENASNDRDGILFLKFRMIGQEFQALCMKKFKTE
jgi:hypothetical protein